MLWAGRQDSEASQLPQGRVRNLLTGADPICPTRQAPFHEMGVGGCPPHRSRKQEKESVGVHWGQGFMYPCTCTHRVRSALTIIPQAQSTF